MNLSTARETVRPGSRQRTRARSLSRVLSAAVVFATLMLLAGAAPASAVAGYECWTARTDSGSVLRCRIGRFGLRDLPGPDAAGVPLYAAMGEDIWGECWFHSDTWSGWIAFGSWKADSALLVFDPGEPSASGYLAARAARRCASDVLWMTEQRVAFAVLRSIDYWPPLPDFDPDRGVVRLPWFLALDVLAAGDIAGKEGVFFEVGVTSVRVTVGAETASVSIPPEGYGSLTGHPDGSVSGVFDEPGPMEFTVVFEWAGRWRTTWDTTWYPVAIGAFAPRGTYVVDEIVGRLVG